MMQVIGYLTPEAIVASPMVVAGTAANPLVIPTTFLFEATEIGQTNIFRRTDGTLVAVTDEGEQVQIGAGSTNG